MAPGVMGKHALLLAATILAARKLEALESDRPSPGKLAAVETAIALSGAVNL